MKISDLIVKKRRKPIVRKSLALGLIISLVIWLCVDFSLFGFGLGLCMGCQIDLILYCLLAMTYKERFNDFW